MKKLIKSLYSFSKNKFNIKIQNNLYFINHYKYSLSLTNKKLLFIINSIEFFKIDLTCLKLIERLNNQA